MSRDTLPSLSEAPIMSFTPVLEVNSELDGSAAPNVYRMRCPNCQKLYSVQSDVLRNAEEPIKFHCSPEVANGGCGTRFTASLEIAAGPAGERVITREIGSIGRSAVAVPRTAVFRAPLISELRCPKCGSRNVLSAIECRFCGIVFAKVKPVVEGGGDFGSQPELSALWEVVLQDYENVVKHETFISACSKAQLLAFAGQKYARILSVTPQEEVARAMRDRVVGLVTHRAVPRGATPAWQFRVPGFNNLILFFGAGLLMLGLMLPNSSHLAGLGFAAIALAVGVRVILRPLP